MLAAFASTSLLTMLAVARPALAQETVAIVVNGSQMQFNQAPIEQAGRVFVPLRGVFERLGASVVYENGEINATGNGRNVSLRVGSTQATVNGQPQTVDVAPFIVGSSTLVPLRFVAQALGASVDWNNNTSTVTITGNGSAPRYANSGNGSAPRYANSGNAGMSSGTSFINNVEPANGSNVRSNFDLTGRTQAGSQVRIEAGGRVTTTQADRRGDFNAAVSLDAPRGTEVRVVIRSVAPDGSSSESTYTYIL